MKEKRFLLLVAVIFAAVTVSGCQVGSIGRDSSDGEFIIDSSGGRGGANGGAGNGGGAVEIFYQRGSGSDIRLTKTGVADAGFTAGYPVGDAGSLPLNITANTVLAVASSEPAIGIPYIY